MGAGYDPVRVSCFVLAGGTGERLRPLTAAAPKPLLRFGGVCSFLDITLSNVANSGLRRAYVLSQYRKEDVADYLAKHWGGSHRYTTQFVHQPPLDGHRYRGTADAVVQNLDRLPIDPHLILVLSADHVYRMDYRKLLQFHIDHGGGVTLAATRVPLRRAEALGVMSIDSCGRVVDFVEKPEEPKPCPGGMHSEALVNMGIYVFDRGAFLQAVADLQDSVSDLDFGRDLIPRLVACRNVTAYVAAEDPFSYWNDIGSPETYYESNMELLQQEPPFDLYHPASWPIHPITTPAFSAEYGPWCGSIVSPLAYASECSIEESILSPGVCIGDGARIVRSILLPGARIGRGASVQDAIIDSFAEVQAGTEVGHDLDADRLRFHVAEPGITIVPVRGRETAAIARAAARKGRVAVRLRSEHSSSSQPHK